MLSQCTHKPPPGFGKGPGVVPGSAVEKAKPATHGSRAVRAPAPPASAADPARQLWAAFLPGFRGWKTITSLISKMGFLHRGMIGPALCSDPRHNVYKMYSFLLFTLLGMNVKRLLPHAAEWEIPHAIEVLGILVHVCLLRGVYMLVYYYKSWQNKLVSTHLKGIVFLFLENG